MYQSFFPRDVFAELDHLQRELQQAFDVSPTIRGLNRGAFPALNIGHTDDTLEIYAFAPGLDPATVELGLERGVLTISGERTSALPEKEKDKKTNVHIQERFAGRFKRVLALPDDADAESATARYSDGVLHVSVRRRASAQPRRITLQ